MQDSGVPCAGEDVGDGEKESEEPRGDCEVQMGVIYVRDSKEISLRGKIIVQKATTTNVSRLPSISWVLWFGFRGISGVLIIKHSQ
jgi:hypothetical protein